MGFSDAIFAINKLKKFISAGTPCVKQVASGTHTFVSNERNSGAIITTGVTVNPAKTVVLLDSSLSGSRGGGDPGVSGHYDAVQSILTEKTATTITVSANYVQYYSNLYAYGTVSWQLIEFY